LWPRQRGGLCERRRGRSQARTAKGGLKISARGASMGGSHLTAGPQVYSETDEELVLDEGAPTRRVYIGLTTVSGVTRIVARPSSRTTMSAASAGPHDRALPGIAGTPEPAKIREAAKSANRCMPSSAPAGIEVMYDESERHDRGVKSPTAELLAFPHRLVVADSRLEAGD